MNKLLLSIPGLLLGARVLEAGPQPRKGLAKGTKKLPAHWLAGSSLPCSRVLERVRAVWELCRIFFRGEKAIEVCDKVLSELAEKGFVEIRREDPERGMKFHVVKRLRKIGLLARHTAVVCRDGRARRIYVFDRKRAAKLRLEFDQLDRPWPICLE